VQYRILATAGTNFAGQSDPDASRHLLDAIAYPFCEAQQHGGAEGERERQEIQPQEFRESHWWPEQLVPTDTR
jgi:hypothetical protein